jgi:hypothetical protein
MIKVVELTFSVVPLSLFVVLVALILAFHKNARVLSTLLIQILLEYADRVSGFSHILGDSQVEKLKRSLSAIKRKPQERLSGGEIDKDRSEEVGKKLSIRRKVSRLVARKFRFRGKVSSSEDVEAT